MYVQTIHEELKKDFQPTIQTLTVNAIMCPKRNLYEKAAFIRRRVLADFTALMPDIKGRQDMALLYCSQLTCSNLT